MFSGFYIKDKKSLNTLSILLFILMIVAGVAELNGLGILKDKYPAMISHSPYGIITYITLAALAVFYLLMNRNMVEKVGYHVAEYYALMAFSFTGIAVLGQFNNLIMMFLGIEILSIPMYILAGTAKNDIRSTEASVKYFLMGAFSTAFMVLGIALIYGATGSFMLENITQHLTDFTYIYYLGWVMLIFAFSFKVSAAPFHFWTPDVYDGTPTVFTSYMSTIVKGASFLGFVMVLQAFPFAGEYGEYFRLLIATIILITLFVGNFSAMSQKSAKRMMSYSSIAQAGFMMFVVFSITTASKEALLFYTVSYAIANFIIFYTLTQIENYELEAFNGLAKRNPKMAFSTAVALISLAGIPLTSGFIAKFMALSIGVENPTNLMLVILALVMAVISIYYYFRLIVNMYFKPVNNDVSSTIQGNVMLVIGAIILLILGIVPNSFTSIIQSYLL